VFKRTIPLVRYRRVKTAKVLRKLLDAVDPEETSGTEIASVNYDEAPITGHWVPTLDISLVMDVPEPLASNQVK
jgi:hypothetical protein